jgi:hypothetical protein
MFGSTEAASKALSATVGYGDPESAGVKVSAGYSEASGKEEKSQKATTKAFESRETLVFG